MSFLAKDRLIFDASDLTISDQVASFLYASDGTALTHTGGALDVSIANASIAVTATDLDIRDLINTQDSIAIGDENNLIDLQQFDAAFGASAFAFPIAGVRRDADTSPVSADGDAHPLVFDANGRLKVESQVTVEPSDAEYAEDSAHASGNVGLHMLAVRQDTLASSVSADGDYGSLKLNADGRLYVDASVSGDVADDAADSGNPLKVGSRAVDGALAAVSASSDRADLISDLYRRVWVNDAPNISQAVSREQVTNTAAELVSAPLAGRKRIMVQNRGSKDVYLGDDNTVTADDAATGGIRVAKGASLELPWGEDLDLWVIAPDAGPHSVFIMEIA